MKSKFGLWDTPSSFHFGFHDNLEGNVQLSDCDDINENNRFKASESSEDVKIVTRGSRPKDLKAWVDADFKAVPIYRRLRKLNQLFKNEWLNISDAYGIHTNLSACKINVVWDEFIPKKYCSLMLSDALGDDCKPYGMCPKC